MDSYLCCALSQWLFVIVGVGGGGSFPYTSVNRWWRERGCCLEEDEVKNSRDVFCWKSSPCAEQKVRAGGKRDLSCMWLHTRGDARGS